MVEIKVEYTGELHCDATHGPSKSVLSTDAPADNKGKGAAFSPTDLVAAALATCISTTMGIKAEELGVNLRGMRVSVQKEMSKDPPRRIVALPSEVHIPLPPDSPHREILEKTGLNCPVHKSLPPEIERPTRFFWEGQTSDPKTMKLKQISVLLLVTIIGLTSIIAQEKKRVSPQEKADAEIGGAKISIDYGAPYTKDPKTAQPRKIWGGLVPWGQVWRTGANEATTLTTSKDLQFGNLTLPAGTYTLFTQPEESGASKLIINKQTGQWGTKYDASQDLGRVDLTKKELPAPVDQFSIAIEKTPSGTGVIALRWEKTEYDAAFKVKP